MLSNGARRGLLLKGGAVLEGLRKVDTVAFDKTGTLTEGKPKVTDVIGFGRSERDVLMLASALEIGSGTGQHAVYFAAALPHLVWQTSELPVHHAGILAWLAEAQLIMQWIFIIKHF